MTKHESQALTTEHFAIGDTIVIKKSFRVRAEQKGALFSLKLRDERFMQLKASFDHHDFGIVLNTASWPRIQIYASSIGLTGWVGAIFFEKIEE